MVSLEGEVQHILSSLHWLYEHQTSTGETETLARCSRPFYDLSSPVPRLLLVLIGGWTVVSILACTLGAGTIHLPAAFRFPRSSLPPLSTADQMRE